MLQPDTFKDGAQLTNISLFVVFDVFCQFKVTSDNSHLKKKEKTTVIRKEIFLRATRVTKSYVF